MKSPDMTLNLWNMSAKGDKCVEDMKRDIVESARHHNIELNKSETERTNEEDRTLGPDNSHENGREM